MWFKTEFPTFRIQFKTANDDADSPPCDNIRLNF